jgi:excinuclease UvrABC helicase subunit UvrB
LLSEGIDPPIILIQQNIIKGGNSMAYTYEQLSKMTVVQLRAIADGIEHEELKGHSTMHKEQLLPLLCKALGVEIPHHHVVGINKTELKAKIHALKRDRATAVEKKDYKKLETIRGEIHKLKRQLRKSMV